MYYVYIIKNKDNRHYIGQTNSLEYRIEMHNKNLVKSTRNLGPWEYVITRQCNSRSEAMTLELQLKKMKNSKKAIEYLTPQSYPD
ncbi:MAG: GIY-YIG nuclease family protein [Ignavibacteriales bacterium]|nr:MAG: GIY-YIG nuclease family protein [Ignavibacteriales bacterium]